MPFSLSKWLKNLGKSNGAALCSSDRKYDTSTSANDAGEAIKRVPTVVVLGASKGTTAHLAAVCDLIAEAVHGVHLRVPEHDVANARCATEEAVSLEAEHLLLVNRFSDQDDTLSVGTVRMPLVPRSTSVNAPLSAQTQSHGEPLRQVLVLLYPDIVLTQAHRLVAEVESSDRLSIDVLAILGCDGLGPSSGNAVVQRDEIIREFHRQRASCGAPLLTFALGATAYDTLELLRPKLDVVCNCSGNPASVSISLVRSDKQEGRDVAASSRWSGDANLFLSQRSVSFRRLAMCRTEALRALRTITANLIRSSGVEERFRILASGSEKFDLVFGKSPNAMQVLRNIGFAECDETGRRIDPARTKLAWGESTQPSTLDGATQRHRLMLSQDSAIAALPELRRLAVDLDDELQLRETARTSAGKESN